MKNNHRGFTLIEVLVYIALFGILIGGAVIATYQLLEGEERNHEALRIEQEGMFLIRKMDWILTNITAFSISPHGTLLAVTKLAGDDFDATRDNPLILTAHDGVVTLKRGNAVEARLNAERYPVEEFSIVTKTLSSNTLIDIRFRIKDTSFTFKTYLP